MMMLKIEAAAPFEIMLTAVMSIIEFLKLGVHFISWGIQIEVQRFDIAFGSDEELLTNLKISQYTAQAP